jgi:[acyl-carrier-protein] S-malonyltransferase
MKAYIFPGQGSQFTGMGLDLYDQSEAARSLFKKADDIIGFAISEIMFRGTEEQLRQTNVTQPAIFIHSVIHAMMLGDRFVPDMAAGHSLGEFSALTAAGALTFEDGLRLVIERAEAMQAACEAVPGTMAAILGLEDSQVEKLCGETPGVVVPANYNCPGQLVISGEVEAVKAACEKMTTAGAKRALLLSVGGAFHSPLMEPARERLAAAIEKTNFSVPRCAIYQNVTAMPHRNPEEIRVNLIAQLTAPVRWTQTVEHMAADGATGFTEVGPGKVLQGLVRKIHREAEILPA